MFQSISDLVNDDTIELVIEGSSIGMKVIKYDLDEIVGGGLVSHADGFVDVLSNLGGAVEKRPSDPSTSIDLFSACDQAVNQYGFDLVFFRIDEELELRVVADRVAGGEGSTIQNGTVENAGAVLEMIDRAIKWEEGNFSE